MLLRIHRFSLKYLDSLNKCFNSIFDKNELTYYKTIEDFSLSYVGVNDIGSVKAFIIVNKTDKNRTESKFGEYEIAYLGVSKKHRGCGYGKILLSLVMNELKGRCLWLNALANNDIACKLYQDIGFREIERYVDTSGNNSITFATVECLE
jgi:ribosomal protein S18 acetylase RimI-like enzyme